MSSGSFDDVLASISVAETDTHSLRGGKRKAKGGPPRWLIACVGLSIHSALLAAFLNFAGIVSIPGLGWLTPEKLWPEPTGAVAPRAPVPERRSADPTSGRRAVAPRPGPAGPSIATPTGRPKAVAIKGPGNDGPSGRPGSVRTRRSDDEEDADTPGPSTGRTEAEKLLELR